MSQQIPATRAWAVWTFLGYGLVVLLSATFAQMYNAWAEASDYPRAVIRAVGVGCVAWGLWQQTRWAWWLAFVSSLLWGVSSGIALAALFNVPVSQVAVDVWPGVHVTSVIAFALALATFVLLLIPEEQTSTDDADKRQATDSTQITQIRDS